MDMRKWFKEAQYGMMVHWGLYSLLAGEYKDRYSGVYAEWIQAHLAIPNAEYGKLTKAFNPVFFNAEEWVKLAKDCGMKYFVVTSKHHDGFAMFHSKVDKYNVVDATPFGRDVVAEIGEACYKHGLKMGLYYSQDLDWHDPNGGGYLSNHIPSQGVTWENSWDFPDTAHKNFDLCFENKIYPQVEELLRNYGDLCLIWFDMPMTLKENQSRALFEAIKKYQPDCLVNSRIGNGRGDYHSCGDNQTDFVENGEHKTVGAKTGLYECPATLNDTWGYKSFDNNWKSADEVIATGLVSDVDAFFGLHVWSLYPTGTLHATPGGIWAEPDMFKVTIHGKGGHGATPEVCVDAITAGAAVVQSLQTIVSRFISPMDSVVVTVGSFHAGTRCNIIAQDAVLEGTLRAFDDDVHRRLLEHFKRIITDVSAAYGCTAEIEINEVAGVVVNDEALCRIANECAAELVPPDRIQPQHPCMLGDDFASYRAIAPSCFVQVGMLAPEKDCCYAHHHGMFKVDEDVLPLCAAWMAAMASRAAAR